MWKCPKCETLNQTERCMICGEPRPQNPAANQKIGTEGQFYSETPRGMSGEMPAYPEAEKKDNKPILIACFAIGLAALIICVFLLAYWIVTGGMQADSDLQAEQSASPSAAQLSENGETEQPETFRLFDNHSDFISTVKKYLNVPENKNVAYNLGEPHFSEIDGSEVVYISFTEDGNTVAAAECLTATGEAVRSIYVYTPVTTPTPAPTTPKFNTDTVTYTPYKNQRFGYTIDVPDFLTPQAPPTNGAGRQFLSDDGSVSLTVSGSHTPAVFEEASTFDGFYNYTKRSLTYYPEYTKKGDGWFVFSGNSGSTVVYQKHIFKSDFTENSFVIRYPLSQEKQFDEIVTHIFKSFQPGIGEDSDAAR